MNNNPIGLFDSGVGGLTVFSKLFNSLPNENYIYYGDTKNLPYGTKTKEELIKLAKDIFDFFERKNVKAVVMACNTTSALTYEALKGNYDFEIYPVIQIAARCIAEQKINKLGVLSTQATADSHAYAKEIFKYNDKMQVIEKGCPGWVQIVENKTQDSPESIKLVKEYLDFMLNRNVDKIILGCTHYPYLLEILSQYAPEDMFIDPSKYVVNYIIQDLNEKEINASKQLFKPQFIVSSEPEKFQKSAELFYKIPDVPKLVLPTTI